MEAFKVIITGLVIRPDGCLDPGHWALETVLESMVTDSIEIDSSKLVSETEKETRTRTRSYKCGNCGEPGHSRRTCAFLERKA